MKRIFSEKYKGAMLAAAIGDALGWPNEQNSNNLNKHYNELNAFVEWSRKCGGRYWPYEERICAGEYSDDTQLLIATLRSLLRGNQWGTYFRQVELPAWLEYQRGGGGATKRAAKVWAKGISPWDERNDEKLIRSYYMAGGNGVVMRIMPHVIKNEEDIDLSDEMADVLWVLLCLANQTGVNLTEAFQRNIDKKTKRDKDRHINNPKLK